MSWISVDIEAAGTTRQTTRRPYTGEEAPRLLARFSTRPAGPGCHKYMFDPFSQAG